MLKVLNIGYGYELFLSLAFPYSGYVNSIDMANVSIHSSSNTWHFLFTFCFPLPWPLQIGVILVRSFICPLAMDWLHFLFTFMMSIYNLSENSI